MADLHCHNWSAFSNVDVDLGINNRLMHILDELKRCAAEVLKAGGDTIIIAGDMFHVRGNVSPSVFNPIKYTLASLRDDGIKFQIIAGNHDLQSKESEALGSSVNMLREDSVKIYHRRGIVNNPVTVILIPWHSTVPLYKEAINETVGIYHDPAQRAAIDLIVHLGIDGSLPYDDGHNVKADWLRNLGFKRVFSGHFHNHKNFGNGIYSIGSPTHHSFRDVGTKSGFMIVHQDSEKWFSSRAPHFIDIDGSEDHAMLPFIVDGHYVRAKTNFDTPKEIEDAREMLITYGALGVQIVNATSNLSSVRSGTSVKTIDDLDSSVVNYINEQTLRSDAISLCADILKEAREV